MLAMKKTAEHYIFALLCNLCEQVANFPFISVNSLWMHFATIFNPHINGILVYGHSCLNPSKPNTCNHDQNY